MRPYVNSESMKVTDVGPLAACFRLSTNFRKTENVKLNEASDRL